MIIKIDERCAAAKNERCAGGAAFGLEGHCAGGVARKNERCALGTAFGLEERCALGLS